MAGINKERRENSNKRILDAAIGEFGKKGFSGTKLSDIAISAKVTQGLVSQRFNNKEELLLETIKYAIDIINFDYDPADSMMNNLDMCIEVFKELYRSNPILCDFIQVIILNRDIPKDCLEYIKQRFGKSTAYSQTAAAIKDGLLKNDDVYNQLFKNINIIISVTRLYINASEELSDNSEYYKFIGINKDRIISDKAEANESIIMNGFLSDYEGVCVFESETGKLNRYIISPVELLKSDIKEKPEVYFTECMRSYCNKNVVDTEQNKYLINNDFDYVKKQLDEKPVYYVNYMAKTEGGHKFYQAKYVKYSFDSKECIIVGIHSIDDVSRKEYEEYINHERQLATIAELSQDFECVDYVSAVEDIGSDDTICFRRSELFEVLTKGWSYERNFHRRIHLLRDNIVFEEDRESFDRSTKYGKIINHLNSNPAYFVNFRANINDKLEYYQAKFTANKIDGVLVGFVVGIRTVDEETKDSIAQQKELEQTVFNRTVELQSKNKALNRMNAEIVELLGDVVESRDEESGEHIRRVKGFTYILAEQVKEDLPEYGLTQQDVNLISSASALHDLGKIMISDTILLKPGKLTKDEFDVMKTHCLKGCEILKKAPKDWSEAYVKTSMDICCCHHEKWDGCGYPMGLKEDEIPISAQIVSIADCFDALTTKRVYKEAYSCDQAFNMILSGECGVFSKKLLNCFEKCRAKFEQHAISGKLQDNQFSPVELGGESLLGANILLVEDNELSMEISIDILKSEGANVVEAENGKVAYDIFKASEPFSFDVIIMDVCMPEMDGITATREIRGLDTEYARNIPILMLTSKITEDLISDCILAGANSYMNKPLVVSKIADILR